MQFYTLVISVFGALRSHCELLCLINAARLKCLVFFCSRRLSWVYFLFLISLSPPFFNEKSLQLSPDEVFVLALDANHHNFWHFYVDCPRFWSIWGLVLLHIRNAAFQKLFKVKDAILHERVLLTALFSRETL